MSLRPVDFQVQPQRRSIIEEAFGAALTGFLTAPIEARAMKQRLSIEEAFREKQDIDDNYTELTPEYSGSLQHAGFDAPALIRTSPQYPGKQFVPRAAVEKATNLNAPVSEPTKKFIDYIRNSISPQVRNVATGGTESVIPPIITNRDYEQAAPILQESIQLYGISQANARERDRVRIDAAEMVARTLGNPDRDLFANKGIRDTDGQTRPLTFDEMVAWQNPGKVMALSQSTDSVVRQIAAPYVAILGRMKNAMLVPLTNLTDEAMSKEVTRSSAPGVEGQQAMEIYGYLASQGGLNWHLVGEGRTPEKITDPTQIAANLRGNEDKLRAVIAFRRYNTVARYLDGERQGGVQLTPAQLGYLRTMFLAKHDPDVHALDARAVIPDDLPQVGEHGTAEEPVVTQATRANREAQRAGADSAMAAAGLPFAPMSPANASDAGPGGAPSLYVDNLARAKATSARAHAQAEGRTFQAPGRVVPPVEDVGTGSYRGTLNAALPILVRNIGHYKDMLDQVNQSFGSADSAVAMFRRNNVEPSVYQDLVTGTPRQRDAALKSHRYMMTQAIRDARRIAMSMRTEGRVESPK